MEENIKNQFYKLTKSWERKLDEQIEEAFLFIDKNCKSLDDAEKLKELITNGNVIFGIHKEFLLGELERWMDNRFEK